MDQAKESSIRVLVVDDFMDIRESLRGLLTAAPGIIVVGEAGDGEEAVLRVDQLKPSVVIMDINMPRMDGIEAAARIKQAYPHIVVIGLSSYATDETHNRMRAAGAATVISKGLAVEQLRDEILKIVNSQSTGDH